MANDLYDLAEKPGTLAEAVAMILVTFGEAELAGWAEKPLNEAVVDAHFDLGLWIRNHWLFCGDSLLVKRIRRLGCCIHDDDISSAILEALWRVLNGEDCPAVEELLEIRHEAS